MFFGYYSEIAKVVLRKLEDLGKTQPVKWYFYGCSDDGSKGWVDTVDPTLEELGYLGRAYNETKAKLKRSAFLQSGHGLPEDLSEVFETIFKIEKNRYQN